MIKKEGGSAVKLLPIELMRITTDLNVGTGKPGIVGHPGKSTFKRG